MECQSFNLINYLKQKYKSKPKLTLRITNSKKSYLITHLTHDAQHIMEMMLSCNTE